MDEERTREVTLSWRLPSGTRARILMALELPYTVRAEVADEKERKAALQLAADELANLWNALPNVESVRVEDEEGNRLVGGPGWVVPEQYRGG